MTLARMFQAHAFLHGLHGKLSQRAADVAITRCSHKENRFFFYFLELQIFLFEFAGRLKNKARRAFSSDSNCPKLACSSEKVSHCVLATSFSQNTVDFYYKNLGWAPNPASTAVLTHFPRQFSWLAFSTLNLAPLPGTHTLLCQFAGPVSPDIRIRCQETSSL